jgi:hypothetical protein
LALAANSQLVRALTRFIQRKEEDAEIVFVA